MQDVVTCLKERKEAVEGNGSYAPSICCWCVALDMSVTTPTVNCLFLLLPKRLSNRFDEGSGVLWEAIKRGDEIHSQALRTPQQFLQTHLRSVHWHERLFVPVNSRYS